MNNQTKNQKTKKQTKIFDLFFVFVFRVFGLKNKHHE
jgi:hypothetical protein